jgi:hypothetical protein
MFKSNNGFSLLPIEFTPAKTPIDKVRAEYLIGKGRVQFHLFPEPVFPDNIERNLTTAFSGFAEDKRVIDYVPEVDSWYVEIKGFGLTDTLVEHLLKKVAKAVDADA